MRPSLEEYFVQYNLYIYGIYAAFLSYSFFVLLHFTIMVIISCHHMGFSQNTLLMYLFPSQKLAHDTHRHIQLPSEFLMCFQLSLKLSIKSKKKKLLMT